MRARELAEIEQRLALIEARLEQLFTHLNVEPRSAEGGWWGGSGDEGADTGGVSDEVRQLALAGNKLEAIQLHCEQAGLGLKDAKAAIDAL